MLGRRLTLVNLLATLGVLAIHVTAMSLSAPVVASSQPRGVDKAGDEEAIRGLVAATEKALNERDFAALSSLYAEDGDYLVLEDPKVSGGREALRSAMEKRWASAPATRVTRLSIDEIRFLVEDVAIVDVTASFSDGRAETRPVYVLVRRGGGWLVAATRVVPGKQ